MASGAFFFLPGVGHQLGLGAYAFVWLEFPVKMQATAGVGTLFSFRLLQLGPNLIGLNLLALSVVLWLGRALPVEAESAQATAEHHAPQESAAESASANPASDVT